MLHAAEALLAALFDEFQEVPVIKRLLSAIIVLPLLILFILKANVLLFGCFIALISCVGLFEFYSMALPERKSERVLAIAAGGLLPLTLLADGTHSLFVAAVALLFLLSALVFLFRINDITKVAGELALLLTGFLYVPFLLGHFILLRQSPHGISWIFLLLIIVMCGDTFAFYVGTSFGKRRLYPVVSPKKSIEGSLGGLVGSVVGALVVKSTFFPELPLGACLSTAVLLGVLGQLGDLFESLLKRSFGVKDSGVIIPGHGGILDRLDSLLFAAPAAYYCARFIFAVQ